MRLGRQRQIARLERGLDILGAAIANSMPPWPFSFCVMFGRALPSKAAKNCRMLLGQP
jgi:hypothetical protein